VNFKIFNRFSAHPQHPNSEVPG